GRRRPGGESDPGAAPRTAPGSTASVQASHSGPLRRRRRPRGLDQWPHRREPRQDERGYRCKALTDARPVLMRFGKAFRKTRAGFTAGDRRTEMDVASLAELLHETAEHHDPYEKSHAAHNWWDWYAAYIDARQRGDSSEEASAAAGRYMEEVLH